MKNFSLLLLILSSLFISVDSFAVKSVVNPVTHDSNEISLNDNKEKSSKKSLKSRIKHFVAKTAFKVLKPKKRRKDGNKAKRYLIIWLLTALGAVLSVVLAYVFVILLAEAGIILFFVFWILAILAAIASNIFLILWIIELANS